MKAAFPSAAAALKTGGWWAPWSLICAADSASLIVAGFWMLLMPSSFLEAHRTLASAMSLAGPTAAVASHALLFYVQLSGLFLSGMGLVGGWSAATRNARAGAMFGAVRAFISAGLLFMTLGGGNVGKGAGATTPRIAAPFAAASACAGLAVFVLARSSFTSASSGASHLHSQ